MLNYITCDVGNLPQHLPTGGHLVVETHEVRINVQKFKPVIDSVDGHVGTLYKQPLSTGEKK